MGFNISDITLTSPGGTTLSMDSGATNWMSVNASGILTRPQTPFMRGQLVGKGSPYNGGAGPLLVTADVNRGGHWDNATGRFTCPKQGYYMVTAGGIASATVGYLHVRKNGGDMHNTAWNHTASWHYVSLSAVIFAFPSDWFSWYILNPSPATAGFYGDGGHGMFSIALMA
jgi:hypothetical protein